MDWFELTENELRKAGLKTKVEKVPKSRCASNASNRELNDRISYRIKENNSRQCSTVFSSTF